MAPAPPERPRGLGRNRRNCSIAPTYESSGCRFADFAILGWAWRHPRHKVELKDFPNVERWYNALMARPATKRGMEAKLD